MAAAYAGVSWDRFSPSNPNPNGFIAQISGDRGQEALIKYSARGGTVIWNYGNWGPIFPSGFGISDRCSVNYDSFSSALSGFYVNEEESAEMIFFRAEHFVGNEDEVYQFTVE